MSVTKARPMVTIGENALVSSGTQYIDTEYILTSEQIKIEIDFIYFYNPITTVIFGSEKTSNRSICAYYPTDSTLGIAAGNSSQQLMTIVEPDTRYAMVVEANNGVLSKKINDAYNSIVYLGTVNKEAPIFLFGNNYNGSSLQRWKGKIFSFKIRDNGVLVRDLVPVPKGSTEFKSKRNLFNHRLASLANPGFLQLENGFQTNNAYANTASYPWGDVLESNKTYTISYNVDGEQNASSGLISAMTALGETFVIGKIGVGDLYRTFTTPENIAEFVSIRIYGDANGTTNFTNIQLEESDTATTYEPFVGLAPSNCMFDKITQTYFENQGSGEFGIEYKQYKTINKLFATIETSQRALVSTGDQYIDTEYIPTSEKLSIEARFKRSPITSNEDMCLCGSQTTGGFNILPYWEHTDSLAIFAGSTMRALPISTAADTWYDLEVAADNGSLTRNLSGAVNSDTYTGTLFKGASMYLFAANATGVSTYNDLYNFSGAIQYFRIWDNDVLVRDMIAVPQGSTEFKSKRNLWDPATAVPGYFQVNLASILEPDFNNLLSDYIIVSPNTQYTFSCGGYSTVAPANDWWNYANFKDKGVISDVASLRVAAHVYNSYTGFTLTFTTASDCNYIRIGARNLSLPGAWVQLEEGDTATAYEPFVGSAPSNCMWCKITEKYYVNQGTGSFGIEGESGKEYKRIKRAFVTMESPRYGLTSTGGQYIDTGHYPASEKLKGEIEFIATNFNRALYGNQSAMPFKFSLHPHIDSNGLLRIYIGEIGSAVGLLHIQVSANVPYKLIASADNGVLVRDLNGVVDTTTYPGSLYKGHSIALFAKNQNGDFYSPSRFIGTIYSFKLWDNDVLVRDFIPVPAGNTTYSSTPAPSNCMWDAVTKQYFENLGTGSFGIEETESAKEYKLVFEDTE